MRAGELCAGYGGLMMAIEQVFNAKPAWVSEFDPAPSKILAYRYPTVPNYGDMTKINWYGIEPVDVMGGGTPCQDLSTAGARRGMTEGTRSNLWVHMREAIAIQKPKFVVWENVRGAYSAEASCGLEQCEGCVGDTSDGRVFLRALGRVLGDLSDLGYDAEWRGLRAADVGAPHGRFRVFVLAANRDYLGEHGRWEWAEQDGWGQPPHSSSPSSDTNSWDDFGRFDDSERGALQRAAASWGSAGIGGTVVPNPHNQGSQGQHDPQGATPAGRHGHSGAGVDWREYTGAVRRWEALHRAAPAPVELGPTGKPRLSPLFTEWMMGLPEGWITDVPGVSWGDQLKACGNGVVPQQAVAALEDMLAAFQGQGVAA